MADPKQKQQKGNQIFGQNYMQKFCIAEWDDVSDRSDKHRSAVQKISQESSQEVGREIGAGGNGPIAAINAVIAKAGELADKGEIDATAAADVKTVLGTLKERVKEQRRQDAETATERKGTKELLTGKTGKVQWTLPTPVSPVVHSLDEFLIDMPARARQHREAQIDALSDEDRARIENAAQGGITKERLGQLITRLS